MRLTFYGHSACLLEIGERRVLIDPFLSGNPLASIGPEDVDCDFLILTHGHADHVGDTEAIARRTGAPIIGSVEMEAYFGAKGLAVERMNVGGRRVFPFGAMRLTAAVDGGGYAEGDGKIVYLGHPAGLVIEAEGKVFHHAGDTGLTYEMKLLKEWYDVDLAMLPIGDALTMGIDDACRAAEFIGAKKVVPMHYGTFEVIDVDPEEFKAKCPCEVEILAPGDSIEI